MSVPLLAVSGMAVSYGRIDAVQDVSLTVPAGQIVTVIGANGAGKSSLLNAIMGLQPATGHVLFEGEDITGLSLEQRVARKISLVPERRELFSTMSVEDNLRLGAYRLTTAAETRADLDSVFARFPRLRERRRQVAGTLSGGERQMLAMARALMGRPRLLMLDEPSLGLAPLIVREVFRITADLAHAGVAILLVEQNARAALRIAESGYVMELGRMTRHAPASDLLADPAMVASYLGGAVGP
jgi:branched-chain amino acid transport system ATP-binding protein